MTINDLLKTNVNDHTEKKNGLTYLSWAWAWAEVLKADPAANFEVKTFEGLPYMNLGESAMVWVTVTIFGKPVTCQLPVLDYRNKCIIKPNAFDINTSIMRCLTKAIAMHGLGLYIYAGEDLPMDSGEPVTVVTADKDGPKAAVQMDTGDAEANAQLFAKSIVEYSNICKDVKALNSYWTANKGQLDSLKSSHPELYAEIVTRFSAVKKELSQPKE